MGVTPSRGYRFGIPRVAGLVRRTVAKLATVHSSTRAGRGVLGQHL